MTSEEIVKALCHCATVDGSGCYECPARDSALKSELNCNVLMKTEAADLIERLEKEKAALLESVRGGCISCKHWAQGTCGCTVVEARARADEDYKCKDCDFGKNWEWKGLEGLLG